MLHILFLFFLVNLRLCQSILLILIIFQAESLTGIKNPVLAGQELLKQGVHKKWVIVKMGPKGSILITKSGISCAPAFKVSVSILTSLFTMCVCVYLDLPAKSSTGPEFLAVDNYTS